MRRYPITFSNGKTYSMYHIGVNYISGAYVGGNISAYKEKLDNEDQINIETGIGDIRYGVIGNIKEAYELLKEVLKDRQPETIYDFSECVQEVILKYFGNFSNTSERLNYFPSEDDIEDEDEIGRVSDLAHKNAAMCVERAMVAHNLLKDLGIDSTFKMSGIRVNGKKDAHAYNLISYEGKYYVFDVTIPTLRDNVISPIICEIPKKTYDNISSPLSDIGESIHVTHYNPLQDKEYDITYDSGRKNIYEVDSSYTK